MRYFFLFVFLLNTSCKPKVDKKSEVEKQKIIVSLDYSVKALSEEYQKENHEIVKVFTEMVQEDNIEMYENYWVANDSLIFSQPYYDLYHVINYNPDWYQPTILAIQKLEENKYNMKIAMMGNPEGFPSLNFIYNVLIVKNKSQKFKFKNVIEDNLQDWRQIKAENITYFLPNGKEENPLKIEEHLNFQKYLQSIFNHKIFKYKYLVCRDNTEIFQLRGYDYEDSMFFNNPIGGLSFTKQKILFSGNNSEYYPHEFVHLYTYDDYPEMHPIIDEGLATYFGGSKEIHFEVHAKYLKEYILKNNISFKGYLFDSVERFTMISENSSILYAGGALLCYLAYEKGGKESLLKLMSTGYTDEDLIFGIEDIFEIDFENFDDFIQNSLVEF